ncbi:hypothetical protein [Paracoccus ravus]|uniref:hypothetical protein n=1 Tax=Paracoccus ravus TaxID=2447760 RepID=UPI00106E609D|nr:hypothetical protein [Paracoccus ravus]
MRPIPAMVLLGSLAACAAPEMPSGASRSMREASCAQVIAAHVARPVSQVSAKWLSEEGGIAQIETRDGARRHICEVDGSGRVLGYSHPPG